jgi:GNAT superfamily N-acetyltransferase
MTSIVSLQPHEFTAEIALPIFEEVNSAVPEDREVYFDIDYVVGQWQALGERGMTETWAAVVDEKVVGLLGALFISEFWSGLPMAMEQFWFVLEAHRKSGAALRLFREFEREAARRGCQTIWAGSNTFHDPGKMAKIYGKKGFELWGRSFRKIVR